MQKKCKEVCHLPDHLLHTARKCKRWAIQNSEWWTPFLEPVYWASFLKTKNTLAELRHSKVGLKNVLDEETDGINKTIWMLWFQGWQEAPWLVKRAAQSWMIHNPGWDIKFLSFENITDYVRDEKLNRSDITLQAKSDIIRLNLLQKYGGVWADATLLCMQPLDNWIGKLIIPSGFWMHHGNGTGMSILEGPCSWFMVSRKDSVISRKWKEACNQFWDGIKIGTNINYFWMDELFKELLLRDPEFGSYWNRVPYVSCELYGGSHCLKYHRNFVGNSRLLKTTFLKRPPFVIKLWWRRWNDSFRNLTESECIKSNAFFAIQCAVKEVSL
jgi:hypothetical protein